MVKSYSRLWPRLISWENMQAAYQRCRRRKRYDTDAAQFHFNWEGTVVELIRELKSGSYCPGNLTSQFFANVLFDQVGLSIKAWLSHASHANSAGIRRAIWRRVKM